MYYKRKSWRKLRGPSDRGKVSEFNRDFPVIGYSFYQETKAVCKRCHYAMQDIEPASSYGEFYHPSLDRNLKPIICVNAGKTFTCNHLEVEPFMRKSSRRRLKRLGIRP